MTFKVSLRSKEKIDVSKIAQYLAAAVIRRHPDVTMTGTPHDVLNNLANRAALEQWKETQEQNDTRNYQCV